MVEQLAVVIALIILLIALELMRADSKGRCWKRVSLATILLFATFIVIVIERITKLVE